MAPYIISPKNPYKIFWDISIGIVYFISYFQDPYIFAFQFRPLIDENLNRIQRIITAILIIDMIVVPFSATFKKESLIDEDAPKKNKLLNNKDSSKGLDDPIYERDIKVLSLKFLKGGLLFAFLSNWPIFIYDTYNGFPEDVDYMESEPTIIFRICFGLKNLRFLYVGRVTGMLRNLKNILGEIFVTKRFMFENILGWLLAACYLIFSIHLFACGWVICYHEKAKYGLTTVTFNETTDMRIFIESIYLMTTTISKVGYGTGGEYYAFIDDSGDWAMEMVYLSIVMIAGNILFSLIVDQIFSYNELITVEKMINDKSHEMDLYLFKISRKVKDKALPEYIFNQCSDHIKESIASSIRASFS